MDSKQPTFWTASKRRLFHKPDGSFDRLCLIFLRTSACHFSASRPTSLPGGTADHCGQIDAKFFVDSALYSGRANHNRALVNNGETHFWTNGQQQDIDTVCTSLPPPPSPIKFNGYTLSRVPIMGVATVKNMIKSCAAKKLKPVCDRK